MQILLQVWIRVRLGALRLSDWLARPLPWMVLLFVGLIARCRQYLGKPSYWYDEAFLTIDVFKNSYLELLGPLAGRTITPPFFLWMLRGCYDAWGPGEWSLRMPAFFAGVAGLLLMICVARRWLGSPGWLWALAFCAVSTHCVHHAVEVRPYATDFLMTALVLLFAHGYVNAVNVRERRLWGAGLLVAAALGPWLSFSSAFVLAAASAALFLNYLDQKSFARLLFWLGLNCLLLISSLLAWYIQARHLYYPGLKEEWTVVWGGFPRDYTPLTVLRWSFGRLVHVAHYASTGLGIPLLLLAVIGAVHRWRRSGAEATLLAGPIVATYLASLAGKYPFADRALFFLAPCVWLLAVVGILALTRRIPPPAATYVPLLVFGLLAPEWVNSLKLCAGVQPKMEYREALAFVQDARLDDDAVWGWCADLNATYFEYIFPDHFNPTLIGGSAPNDAARAAVARPLWIIAPNNKVEEMLDPLRSLPIRQTVCRQFRGVKVLRLDPLH